MRDADCAAEIFRQERVPKLLGRRQKCLREPSKTLELTNMNKVKTYNAERSWPKASVSPPSVIEQFADQNIRLNERGKPWSFFEHQRTMLARMYERHYSIRLISEPKKSGKTFIAAVIALAEAIMNADSEVVCCANDEEQAVSRVFATCCALIKHNPRARSVGNGAGRADKIYQRLCDSRRIVGLQGPSRRPSAAHDRR
jgi:hypothetical protein